MPIITFPFFLFKTFYFWVCCRKGPVSVNGRRLCSFDLHPIDIDSTFTVFYLQAVLTCSSRSVFRCLLQVPDMMLKIHLLPRL